MLIRIAAAVALIGAGTAWGQSASPNSFEVASVKPAAPCCAPGQWRESKANVDRIDFPNATLRACLAFAYGVKEYQVSGLPWLGELRYDIVAKGPEGTHRDQLPGMMQILLAERFGLKLHHETKEFSVIVLTVGKSGPRLQDSPPPAADAPEGARIGLSMTPAGVGRMEVKQGTMTSLVNTLSRLLGRPVVDATKLTGRYDFELEYSPDDSTGMMLAPSNTGGAPPAAREPGISIFSSIQLLGLKLEPRKVPMDAIVVDSAEKVPTGN